MVRSDRRFFLFPFVLFRRAPVKALACKEERQAALECYKATREGSAGEVARACQRIVDDLDLCATRVREVIELFVFGGPVLRATLSEAREVRFEDTTRGCVISVPRTQPAADMYACLENMSVHEVSCDDRDPSVLTFNYIY